MVAKEEGPCAVPEPVPLVDAIRDIINTLILLAMIAILVAGGVILVGGTGGAAGPVVAAMMASLGLTALTFPATAGGVCELIPIGFHKGGDPVHDFCADTVPPNMYPGSDICVMEKNFDAISGNILWETKTNNWDNANAFVRGQVVQDYISDAEKESSIARGCGFGYNFLVGDPRYTTLLLATEPAFQPALTDLLVQGPNICVQP